MKPQVSGLYRVITFYLWKFPHLPEYFYSELRRIVNHLTANISQMLANKYVACTGQHHWEHVKRQTLSLSPDLLKSKSVFLTNFLESQKYSSLKSTVLGPLTECGIQSPSFSISPNNFLSSSFLILSLITLDFHFFWTCSGRYHSLSPSLIQTWSCPFFLYSIIEDSRVQSLEWLRVKRRQTYFLYMFLHYIIEILFTKP